MAVKTNVDGISISPLKTALQYADSELGITVASSTYAEICQALSDYFPEFTGTIYDGSTGESVPFDTNIYNASTTVTGVYSMSINASDIGTSTYGLSPNNSASIVTMNPIDFTNFNMLYIRSTGGTTYSIDVSGITGEKYVCVGLRYIRGITNPYRANLYVTNTKQNWFTNGVSNVEMIMSSGNFEFKFNKLWCA